MTIGIDARMLGPENGGLGRYVQQLIKYLPTVENTNRYIVFLKKSNWDKVQETDRIHKVLADIPWYSLQEQTKFGALIKKEKVDLMHFPHWNVPLFYNDPFVVTIHDLIMYHYPRQEASTHGPVVYWAKDMIHRMIVRHAVKAARHVLVTSEWTKNDVYKTLGVPLEKMTVTYQAPFVRSFPPLAGEVGGVFSKSNDSLTADPLHLPLIGGEDKNVSILQKFDINKPYVLYVGAAYPHKNLDRLIEAWKMFEEKYGSNYQLVFAGRDNFFYQKIKSSNLSIFESSHVVHTGFVNDEELSELYQHAKLYVFPSLYEGFGLPPLEAMSYGVPVVSSNASCLPEVLGQAALYFDPENVEQMADVIYQGLSNSDVRSELRLFAKEELKRYSWERCAEKTLKAYELVN